MRNYEFFAKCVESETPAFLRVLRAVPGDQLHYRPHEKNTPAGALSWQMAREMESLAALFVNGVIDYKSSEENGSIAEAADLFERSAKEVVERARATNEDLWRGPAKFLYNGQAAWEAPAADMAWGFLFDLIHHRGQLSVYLRPMGAKVP